MKSDVTDATTYNDYADFIEALGAIIEAWNNPGPHPRYHLEKQIELKQEWPTLYEAIVTLAEYELTNP